MGALPGGSQPPDFQAKSPAQNVPLYSCSAEVELWSDSITGDCRSRCGGLRIPHQQHLFEQPLYRSRTLAQNQWLL